MNAIQKKFFFEMYTFIQQGCIPLIKNYSKTFKMLQIFLFK